MESMEEEDLQLGERLKKISKEKSKREKWIKTRMWFSTFMSKIYPDMGYIPENIGNNIFIGNNQYVTKNSLNAMILIREFSEESPISFMSELLREVKTEVSGVSIDFTLKNTRHNVDVTNKGLINRTKQWMNTLDNPNASDRSKQRAARLLYSFDVAKAKEKMFKTHTYITIRAKTGSELAIALRETRSFLDEHDVFYKVIKSDLKTHLEYAAMVSDVKTQKVRDIPYTIQSALTISELLPSIQGLNDSKGLYMGFAMENKSPYYIDYRTTAAGKNVYVVGPSGEGKTFLVTNWALDGYATGYNVCFMDLKGTDYKAFTEATNGKTLYMGPNGTKFVNTFKIDKGALKGVDPVVYFNERVRLSKNMLGIIADLGESLESRGEALIDEFLKAMYLEMGVMPDNPNTWERTMDLHPFKVFDYFRSYMSPEIRYLYRDVSDKMMERFKMYIERSGSYAHMFREEYAVEEILDAKVLRFDFGLLESGKNIDVVTFKLKVMYMKYINDEYSRYKKSLGEWVVKVLEESQIAEDYLLSIYVEEMTLRRAQNQVTVLLGNSVNALKANGKAQALFDNINILVVGGVNKTSREYLIEEYGLEKHRNDLENIGSGNPEYANHFFLVNRMQKNSTTATVKAYVPKKVADGVIFRNVDTEEEAI